MADRRLTRREALHAGLIIGGLALASCARPTEEERMEPSGQPAGSPEPTNRGASVLLAYFSRAGENYYYGDRIDLEVGNTAVVAGMIADAADVDVFRIVEVDTYPHDYEETVERNVREENADARPAVADEIPDVADYDIVLLGCPVWNVQEPMIIRTFLEAVDLGGKTVHPFVTYAVSGMGRVAENVERFAPGATIGEGLAVQGEEARDARSEVEEWLARIGLVST